MAPADYYTHMDGLLYTHVTTSEAQRLALSAVDKEVPSSIPSWK